MLDEAALLACSVYIDLNPIRAGMAETPETSEFTGAYERIAARQRDMSASTAPVQEVTAAARPQAASLASAARKPARSRIGELATSCTEIGDVRRADDWLSPIPNADVRPFAIELPSPHRASQEGFLPLALDDYLALLDWTGRQTRAGQAGVVPADLKPILERLQINADCWMDSVRSLGRRFHRAIGRASSMAARAACSGKRWLHGVSASRLAFT